MKNALRFLLALAVAVGATCGVALLCDVFIPGELGLILVMFFGMCAGLGCVPFSAPMIEEWLE